MATGAGSLVRPLFFKNIGFYKIPNKNTCSKQNKLTSNDEAESA